MKGPLRVLVVGAGPAGLFAAQLLKKADPRRTVRLRERNAADVTSGWGVVFSGASLESLRRTDPSVVDRITQTLPHWETIRVQVRGHSVRFGGNPFWGAGRSQLLRILRADCEQTGVELAYESPLEDMTAFGEYDLVVAADGVHSRVRESRKDVFRPDIAVSRNKYTWLGTRRSFDDFLFSFRETPHGCLWVYAYRFADDLSTFNIECSEETWRRAGLDRATEAETIAYCESAFAEDLQGERLLPNRSLWFNFYTVRNQLWHADNIALIGDAAHTTHFTVGCGTTLAMEDAAALARTIDECPDVPTALVRYEEIRRGPVARLQRAAGDSTAWFEHIDRRARLLPEQFAAALCMRSGELTYERIVRRDGDFARRAVAAFAGADEFRGRPAEAPIQLGSLRLDGRLVAWSSGVLIDGSLRATVDVGPAALLLVEDVSPGALERSQLETWASIVAAAGVPLGIQVLTDTSSSSHPSDTAIRTALDAGVATLQCVFGSPSDQAWAAQAKATVARVRRLWPLSRPLFARPNLDGIDDDSAIAFARALVDLGCDVIVCPAARCDAIRNEARVMTMAVDVDTTDRANTLLLGGVADLVMMRPSS